MWDKFKAWWANEKVALAKSGTIIWSWAKVVFGTFSGGLVYLYDDPTINAAIQAALQPKYLPFYLIAGGLFCRYLRKRNSAL